MNERLLEAVKSQRNRLAIATHLIQIEAWDLLCTVLEDVLYYQQAMVEAHCIKDGDSDTETNSDESDGVGGKR